LLPIWEIVLRITVWIELTTTEITLQKIVGGLVEANKLLIVDLKNLLRKRSQLTRKTCETKRIANGDMSLQKKIRMLMAEEIELAKYAVEQKIGFITMVVLGQLKNFSILPENQAEEKRMPNSITVVLLLVAF